MILKTLLEIRINRVRVLFGEEKDKNNEFRNVHIQLTIFSHCYFRIKYCKYDRSICKINVKMYGILEKKK